MSLTCDTKPMCPFPMGARGTHSIDVTMEFMALVYHLKASPLSPTLSAKLWQGNHLVRNGTVSDPAHFLTLYKGIR